MKHTFARLNFDEALRELPPRVRQAFELSHEALRSAGIPHVVVGGLAVNAYGHRYSTGDVDYLVDPHDAFSGTVILTHRPGVPFEVAGIPIDYVTAREDYPTSVKLAMETALLVARKRADKTGVVPDWLLVWMKLNAGRSKDLAAVEGLIQVGLFVDGVALQLELAGPQRVVDLFKHCVAKAEGMSREAD